MKKNIFFLLAIYLAGGCGPNENKTIRFSSYSMDTSVGDTLRGKTIWSGKAGETANEIALYPPYLVVCRQKSDTVLQVFSYEKETVSPAFAIPAESIQMTRPRLAKHNSRAKKNEITLYEGQLHQWKTIDLARRKVNPEFTSFPRYYNRPHPIYIPDCNDLHIFRHAIYATDIAGLENPISLFYRYDPQKKECKHIPPFAPLAGPTPPSQPLFYTRLAVNEKQDRVVAALRFFNSLSFFDLAGNPLKVITYGENFQRPLTDTIRGFVDRINSPKYFLDIQCTDRYVYGLYDGSADMTNLSRILVFEWDGTHVATWQTDRNLHAFAVDPHNDYMLALTPNAERGQDIICYILPFGK